MTPSESNYGKIAILARRKAVAGIDAKVAWETTAETLLARSPSASRKSCPKMAFLGLVNAGRITGVRGDPTKLQSANGGYALAAIELLEREPSHDLNPNELWRKVMAVQGIKKHHNAQMHVVIALWNEGVINSQDT